MFESRRVGAAALLLMPAALMVYFAFNSGGFYPAPTAYAAVLLCIVALVRVIFASDPLAGVGWGLGVAAGAGALLALLALVSSAWSHAPGITLVEFDLPLVYVMVMVIIGSIGHSRARVAWTLRILGAALVFVCACGLVTRLLPHVWPTTPELANNRLSFPVTYWNVLGILAVLGILLCVHFSSDPAEDRLTRVLAAGALPLPALTLYFTFSRGAIAVGVLTLIVYVLVARPRLLVSTLIAAIPTVVALKFAYDANLLATADPTTPAAVSQGHRVAVALAVSIGVALLVRSALLALDLRLLRVRLPATTMSRVRRTGWITLAAACLIAVIALNGRISHDYHQFMKPSTGSIPADLRTRLTDPGSNGRSDMWRIAWHTFKTAPVGGNGAGSFVNAWNRSEPNYDPVRDAHSLYMETFSELGIGGVALLLVVVLSVLIGAARRIRGPNRVLYAALFSMLLAWALHAGVDWDWEMPVVTVLFFGLGGLALAREERPAVLAEAAAPEAQAPARLTSLARVQLGIGCLLLAVAPTYLWLSQRKLDQASVAFAAGNCRVASQEAISAINTLGVRPEPYQILSFCDIRQGLPRLAIDQIQRAISLDPHNWKYTYSLALMRAAAGLDPHAAATRALEMNPREPLIQDAYRLLRGGNPEQWESVGRQLTNQFTSL